MAAGHTQEQDGKLWTIVLRDGLKFHDGEPVRARDCVASLQRWSKRDAYGQALFAATDELTAKDDRTLVFRLKQPFPRLPDALGKLPPFLPVIMPERLAKTDPFTQVTEMVGSGPFRFNAAERVVGSRVVYDRFDGYKPREDGTPDTTSGPKIVNLDRVEWHIIPDFATAASALQADEIDWWESPAPDLLPLLKKDPGIKLDVIDPIGGMFIMRMNQLHPPFDNPAIRRAVMASIDQNDMMQAYAGDDHTLWRSGVGIYPPGSALATDVGMEALAKPDIARAKAELAAAGYNGEKVVMLVSTDIGNTKVLADIGADAMRRMGMNIDYQAMDWGTLNQRRVKMDAVDQGGWSVFYTLFYGLDQLTPAGNLPLRGNGRAAWFGWPTSPKLEALRDAWMQASDPFESKVIGADIQRQALIDLPYIPLGQTIQPTAYRTSITDVPRGPAVYWGVRKTT